MSTYEDELGVMVNDIATVLGSSVVVALAGGGSATTVSAVRGSRDAMMMDFGEGKAGADQQEWIVRKADLAFTPTPGCTVTDSASGVAVGFVVNKVTAEVNGLQWRLRGHRVKAMG